MNANTRWLAASALAATVLAGCASGPRTSDAEKLALYEQHAGAPVSSFMYTMPMDGWTPLG
ncbi:MAG: DUF6491 family protein, partial [Pigmentiphaga sp.]